MIEHRLQQGKRAFALWKRRCMIWMLNGRMAERLFKICVLPALEYGIGLWGVVGSGLAVWEEVEKFWRMAARTILQVPIRTPTAAVLGDLGWRVLYTRAVFQAVCFWTRVTDMGDEALLRKAMYVQRECLGKCGKGKGKVGLPWLESLSVCICKCPVGMNVWNKWMDVSDLHIVTSQVFPSLTGGNPVIKRWEDDVFSEVC